MSATYGDGTYGSGTYSNLLLPTMPPDGRVLTVTTQGRLVPLEALPREVVLRAAGRTIRIPVVS